MEDKIVYKFIAKFKDKLSKNKTTYPTIDEYAFSSEEIENMSRQNKQKIQELKQDVFLKKKNVDKQKQENKEGEIIRIVETVLDDDSIITNDDKEVLEKNDDIAEDEEAKGNDIKKVEEIDTVNEVKFDCVNNIEEIPKNKNSFVYLSEEYQEIVMNKWKEIDLNQIDKDIIDGKDLLNHNYTITYADEAARFIHDIRKRYEVVICYLIGFNNEKKGIFEKTIFSNTMEEEWRFLSNYVKVLEKIRNFRKNS